MWSIVDKELPPLARGIQLFTLFLALHIGITPACAGNTALRGLTRRSERNYPRLRGEYFAIASLSCGLWELPPLARGIPPAQPVNLLAVGITPACAGNTAAATADRPL